MESQTSFPNRTDRKRKADTALVRNAKYDGPRERCNLTISERERERERGGEGAGGDQSRVA